MFGKNEDRVIDNLLRANTRGRSGAPTSCREFDPDLANAYIERSLTAGEQVGYERHLSVCHACRSSMVALARMAAAEAAPYSLARPVIEPGRFATLKSLFTAPVLPRMAAAALAIIVLAISIPLLISRKDSAPSPAASSSEAAVADQKAKAVPSDLSQPQAPTPGNESVNAPRGLVSTSTTEPSGPAKTVEETDRRAQDEIAVAKEQPTEPDAAAAGARAARNEPPQTDKIESRAAESTFQERKTEGDAKLIAKDQPDRSAASCTRAEARADQSG